MFASVNLLVGECLQLMVFIQAGEQTDPVPNEVCKQLFKGLKILPERRMKKVVRW